MAFEAAEREPDPEKRQALMTFVIIGGGPTGGGVGREDVSKVLIPDQRGRPNS